jgi:hypothetical protein
MFPTLVLAAALTTSQCWNIYDGALRHSAEAAHPTYISYDIVTRVTEDEQPLVYSRAHVDYRDDGLARVSDERFNFEPIVTRHTEPGPPVIGPYGSRRDAWLPKDSDLPIIADVRAKSAVSCSFAPEAYRGHSTFHLAFAGGHTGDRPAVKAMWVDARTADIWKVVVSGPVTFGNNLNPDDRLVDFQVELSYFGPYLLVDHVVWQFKRHEFSQYASYFGEYTLNDYAFPSRLPASYFAQATALNK